MKEVFDITVSLPHRQFTIRTVSKRSMMIDFILIFPPSLSFFPARNNAKSVGNPTHTREGGWLTALVQKSRERLACSLPSHQFIASPLLFDRKLSLPDEGYLDERLSHSFPPSPVKVDEASYSSKDETQQARNEYRNCTSTRLVEGNGSWKRAVCNRLRSNGEETLSARVYPSVAF